MSTRVLATEQARAAAQQMRQIVSGSLANEIQRLRAAGQVLCNPSDWDSAVALQFRTRDWPQMSRTMAVELEELGKLSTSVPKIIQDILTAGNEGGGGQVTSQAQSTSTWDAISDLGNRINGNLSWALNPITAADGGALAYNGYRYFKTAQKFPDLAPRLFSDAMATHWGGGTLQELERAAEIGTRRIEIAKVFTRVADFRKLADGSLATVARELQVFAADAGKAGQLLSRTSALFTLAAKWSIPAVVAADVLTIINPGTPGVEGYVIQGLSGVNLAGTLMAASPLLLANTLDWIPVAGQIIAVTTGLILAGDWAYHTFPGFRNFCDGVGHGTVSIAKDTWHGISSTAGAISHLF